MLGTRYVNLSNGKVVAILIKQSGIDQINENVQVILVDDDEAFVVKANTPDNQLPALVETFVTAKIAQNIADQQLNQYAQLN